MKKPPTGEPCAGKPPARFGGRGGESHPDPYHDEIDSNTVERSIRGLALTRKNALFAGHDQGGMNWAMIASLLETCKLNAVDPLAWTTDTLTKLVNRWPASRIEELMPWAYAKHA